MVGVLLDNFAETSSRDRMVVTEDDANEFVNIWHRYDPNGTHFIKYADLIRLINNLPKPLGLVHSKSSMFSKLCRLNPKVNSEDGQQLAPCYAMVRDGEVFFYEVIRSLGY